MNSLLLDLKYAARQLVRTPLFTVLGVVMLGLGIGLNTGLFSVTWSVLLKPLPFAEPDRTVKVYALTPEGRLASLSYPDVRDLRAGTELFSEVATSEIFGVALSRERETQALWGELVSGNYFEALPVRPLLGRLFGPEVDTSAQAATIAVLSHRAWRLHFDSDPKVVGRTVTLNGQAFTISGITPEDFRGVYSVWFSPDLWIPVAAGPQLDPARRGALEARDQRQPTTLGRLAPGVSVAQAQAQVETFAQTLARIHPESHARWRARVLAETDTRPETEMGPGARAAMLVFHALAGLVLLVACANVSNLLLARAASRRREVAIRIAVGAGRARLVRQLLVEASLIAALAATLGTALAWLLVKQLAAFQMPTHFPLRIDVGVDAHALAFSVGLATVTALLFGLLPALQTSRPDLVPALKGESAGSVGSRSRLMSGLVVAQIAVSIVLLVAGGLFLRSMGAAGDLELGFRPERLLLANLSLDRPGEQAPGYREQLILNIKARVASLPGVLGASLAAPVPMEFWSSGGRLYVDGREVLPGEEPGLATLWSRVAPDYFEVMETRIEQGRGFEVSDDAPSRQVAVVNRRLAETLWPGLDPIGRALRVGAPDAPPVEVVGVAQDGKYNALFEPQRTYLFTPLLQASGGGRAGAASAGMEPLTLLVRTEGDPTAMAPTVRAELHALDASLPVLDVKTMEELIDGRSFVLFRLGAGFGGAMGLMALALAVIGLYGLVSLSVTQRTREIGVRMALGAQRGAVLRLVLRQGMGLVALGGLIGGVGAFGVGRVVSSLLIGVGAHDPLTLGLVMALLAAVAAVATLLPARRAAGVDPIQALRTD